MLVGLRIADERQNGVKLSVLLIKIKNKNLFSDFYRVNIIFLSINLFYFGETLYYNLHFIF